MVADLTHAVPDAIREAIRQAARANLTDREPPLPLITPEAAIRLGPVTITELSEHGIDAVADADGNRYRVRTTRRLDRAIYETMTERQIDYHRLVGMRLVVVQRLSATGRFYVWEIQ